MQRMVAFESLEALKMYHTTGKVYIHVSDGPVKVQSIYIYTRII